MDCLYMGDYFVGPLSGRPDSIDGICAVESKTDLDRWIEISHKLISKIQAMSQDNNTMCIVNNPHLVAPLYSTTSKGETQNNL